jgi:ribosome-associated protein
MDDIAKSKTQKKNEVKALQKMGEQLVKLSSDQLKTINLPENLLAAIEDAQLIPQHEANRRQMQYIGKIMRKIDPAPIQDALQNFQQGNYLKALEFKKIEHWRDELKSGNTQIIEEIIATCSKAQRQRLNQLVRNARKLKENVVSKEGGKSKEDAKAAKASKALFRYLKEIYDY